MIKIEGRPLEEKRSKEDCRKTKTILEKFQKQNLTEKDKQKQKKFLE